MQAKSSIAPFWKAERKTSSSAIPAKKGGVQKKRATEAEPKEKKRKSPFFRRWVTAGMLALASALAVLYVANAIAVNELVASISSLEAERNDVRKENERLRAELLRLMTVENVTARAKEIGMVQPDMPPIALPLAGNAGVSKKPTAHTGEE